MKFVSKAVGRTLSDSHVGKMATNVSTPALFKKLKTSKPINVETKQVILNVYCQLRKEHPGESINTIIKRVSCLTGAGTTTVWRIKKSAKEGGEPQPPKRSLFSEERCRPKRTELYDSFTLSTIRRIVHDFFRRNEPPTVQKVLDVVSSDENLPNFRKSTMRQVLLDIGFVYSRRKRRAMLIDREDIQLARRKYLRSIRQYRQEGREVYYLDETWVNAGHHKSIVWQDSTIKSTQQAHSEALTTGLKAPTGKGSRLIITHAGNENGFVNNALDIFVGKKSGDYHEEMDGAHFETWFTSKLLPNIEPHSVIVMDNASYHSVKLERVPTKSTRKAEIQAWLSSKGIYWTEDMIIRELLALVEPVRTQYDAYKIDTIANEYGHTVLRLPPYHCELNPIEMVWGHVKNRVASENTHFSLQEVKLRAIEAMQCETAEMWANSVRHAIGEETTFWELDGMIDQVVEPIIISFDNESDSDSSCSSS